jgi:hypothetical protein
MVKMGCMKERRAEEKRKECDMRARKGGERTENRKVRSRSKKLLLFLCLNRSPHLARDPQRRGEDALFCSSFPSGRLHPLRRSSSKAPPALAIQRGKQGNSLPWSSVCPTVLLKKKEKLEEGGQEKDRRGWKRRCLEGRGGPGGRRGGC